MFIFHICCDLIRLTPAADHEVAVLNQSTQSRAVTYLYECHMRMQDRLVLKYVTLRGV